MVPVTISIVETGGGTHSQLNLSFAVPTLFSIQKSQEIGRASKKSDILSDPRPSESSSRHDGGPQVSTGAFGPKTWQTIMKTNENQEHKKTQDNNENSTENQENDNKLELANSQNEKTLRNRENLRKPNTSTLQSMVKTNENIRKDKKLAAWV